MQQSWNNILNYIKRQLGGKLNLIEMSDEEILEGIREDVMPFFSQYVPLKKGTSITEENRVGKSDRSLNRWTYNLPVAEDVYIIDIFEVYSSPRGDTMTDPYYGTKYSKSNVAGSIGYYGRGDVNMPGGGMIDMVISNQFLDMIDSLSMKNTWEFRPPRLLVFDASITHALVVYNTIHDDPKTVDPSLYNIIFKPLCLATVIEWIVALRSKYQQLSTQMGEIQLNFQELQQKGERLKQEAIEKLNQIPPDHFIYWSDN